MWTPAKESIPEDQVLHSLHSQVLYEHLMSEWAKDTEHYILVFFGKQDFSSLEPNGILLPSSHHHSPSQISTRLGNIKLV